MRLWSLHPKYLDRQGLLALWREALLAQAVLQGSTRGYRSHPQLERFLAQRFPLAAIGAYLLVVCSEAGARGYAFDSTKILIPESHELISITSGQVRYEWNHLLGKLAQRNVELHRQWSSVKSPRCHPLFKVFPGDVEAWERRRGRQ